MQQDLVVKTKTLGGVSDLTLFAPIRQGFVPSLESVTYKTRLKTLLRTLSGARTTSVEYALTRAFSDSVQRVNAIHSVRVVIREPENIVMLAATFDGAWETYIRVLWQKVGTLLDVIFCNTEGYVGSWDHSYDEWAAWAKRVQVETEFFYSTPGLTVPDTAYLRGEEALHRELPPPGSDSAAAIYTVTSPELQAWQQATGLGTAAPPIPMPMNANIAETLTQGLQALAVVYRLTDLYLPGTDDGGYLQRAAPDLLLEFHKLDALNPLRFMPEGSPPRLRFAKQLAWFEAARSTVHTPPAPAGWPIAGGDVQGGIVNEYIDTSHGALLLIALDSAAAWADFLTRIGALLTLDNSPVAPGPVFVNLAFTPEGLRAIGVPEAELARFPAEFREGMAARASVLGDLRINHPRRWHLPQRNWRAEPAARGGARVLTRWAGTGAGAEVELSSVHVVVQLRVASASVEFDDIGSATHPLNASALAVLGPADSGAELLSVQSMRRHFKAPHVAWEHFGFVDGIGQPVLDPAAAGTVYPNVVPLGDLLLGHANGADESAVACGDLQHNGSFLVVRKLRQDVAAFEHVLDHATADGTKTRDDVLTRLMGRTPDGTSPLAAPKAPARSNDFDYAADPTGARCPFHAHARRANPRAHPLTHEPAGGRLPRIVRRGMSYGPRYDASDASAPVNLEERGIVFMAFNASIGEQFETIQRWISGGNAASGDTAGTHSTQSDPFLGVPLAGRARTFRYVDRSGVQRIELNTAADPTPLVRLEWGAYLFAPSKTALNTLQAIAAATVRPAPAWSVSEGLALLEQLEAADRRLGDAAATLWKAALEDPEERRLFRSAAIWAAIRAHRGGVLRTSFGVLVADRERVMEVFGDRDQRYTVSGYRERMERSFGSIFLGLDRAASGACPYDEQSRRTNVAIQAVPLDQAFDDARKFTHQRLDQMTAVTMAQARAGARPTWELTFDVKEVGDDVLACLCEEWFGLPGTGRHLMPGGWRWDWADGSAPLYPGHFTAPSRYLFQPAPGPSAERIGQHHGQVLLTAMRAFVAEAGTAGPESPAGSPAPIGAAIFAAGTDLFGRAGQADARERWIASTMIGVMVGFLPSVDGNLRASLNEWLKDGTFWRLRTAIRALPAAPDRDTRIRALMRPELVRAMQLRPAPETVWRIAAKNHRLGPVDVRRGELVVPAIVSATQQDLDETGGGGYDSAMPIFGGARDSSPHQPVHACPGYACGMGALLGMVAALLDRPETLRPTPAPLSFALSGPVPKATAATS